MQSQRFIYYLLIATIFLVSAPNLSAQDSKLQFNNDSTFKIVQFTDMHFYKGGEKSSEVLENIKSTMRAEKPDLVVLTGDIVTEHNKYDFVIASWKILTDLLIKFKTPYAVVFGNHDDEGNISRDELLEYLSGRPYCIISDEGGERVKGIGNYVLPIYNSDGVVEKVLFCMDSGTYSSAEDKGVTGYGWFDRSQIKWFAETNQSWLNINEKVQALFFFHIPLPEYKQAYYSGEYKNGVRMEEECSPKINTGLFSEMVLQGNVLGSFVGHDHNNNYVAQLFNIAMCYGYFSGGNTYGDLPLNGARIILLKKSEQAFTTWLRRIDGKILYKVKLPYSQNR